MSGGSCHKPPQVRYSRVHSVEESGSHSSILAFLEAGNTQKAMVAFEKNLQWRELFDLAFLNGTAEEELQDMAYRVSGKQSDWSMISRSS